MNKCLLKYFGILKINKYVPYRIHSNPELLYVYYNNDWHTVPKKDVEVMNQANRETGTKQIQDNGIKELSYTDALNQAIKELNKMGITDINTFYASNNSYLDNPIYPANAELYDEFVDEHGFCEQAFVNYCVNHMDKKNESL